MLEKVTENYLRLRLPIEMAHIRYTGIPWFANSRFSAFFPKKITIFKRNSTFFQHLLYYKREVRIPVVIQAKSCIKFCQEVKICDI